MTGRASGMWAVDNLLRPVMIAGMLACLIAPLLHALQWLGLSHGNTFLLFAFFASLEGILSERLLQRRRITGWSYFGSRLAEAILLLLLLKFSTYLSLGLDQLFSDAQTWLSDPYSFVTGVDLLLGMLFLVMWRTSLDVARMVMDLDVTEARTPPPEDKTSIQYYRWMTEKPIARDRQETLGRLSEVVMWGGIALLVASAAVHLALGSAQPLAVPMLLYFALGVAMLTQARFSTVHLGWKAQGIDVHPQVGRRWLVWVTVFLVGVALVVLILPTHYTLGPLQVCLGVFSIIWAVFSFLIGLLFFLLMLPLALLLPSIESPVPPTMNTGFLPPAETTGTSAQSPWLQILGSAAFWAMVLAILGYAIIRFWRDRTGGKEEGEAMSSTLWARFVAWIRALGERWWALRQQFQEQIALRRAAHKAGGQAEGRLPRLFFPGRLPPREMVRFFYLSAARRAAEAGQPRHSNQTPYEYQESLDQRFPELEPDLEGLTDAFVHARYSSQPVEQESAISVKPLWQRVQAALRRRRE